MEPKVTQYGSQMIMTNVSPPIKRKFLNIDTKYRDAYDATRPANYNITLSERINNIKSMRLSAIEVPMTFYNISANLGNNVFTITVVGVKATIVIPDGQYDIQSLVDAVNGQIEEAGQPYPNIIFSVEDNFCVFSNSDLYNEYFIDFDVNIQGAMDMNNLMFKMGWLMGFRLPSYMIPPMTNMSSLSFLDLNGPRYLYLVLDEFQNSNPHSYVTLSRTCEINQNVLARITMNPIDYPFGTILPANTSNGFLVPDQRVYSGRINLERMNVQLINENGIPMDMNGMDFSFCMELEYE